MDRNALCQARATINSDPAVISGAQNDFATVTHKATGLSVEFAWPTVERIVTLKQGRFFS